MNKPNNPKCDTCFIIDNVLRCWNCKYRTIEWENKNMMPIIIRNEKDLYKPKIGSEEWVNLADDLIPIIDGAESEDKNNV